MKDRDSDTVTMTVPLPRAVRDKFKSITAKEGRQMLKTAGMIIEQWVEQGGSNE
jgi:hypothetical protein